MDRRSNQLYFFKTKPYPDQGPNSLQFCEEVRKLQKKSLKIAEVGSWGLRNEAISITVNHLFIQQRMAQHCESTIFKFKKKCSR